MPRVFLNRSVQIQPKSWREIVQVIFSQVLSQSHVEQLPFDQVVEESDYLSVHVPLTPETQHLIDRQVFHRMKPTAILINTARGKVVDSEALLEAFRD